MLDRRLPLVLVMALELFVSLADAAEPKKAAPPKKGEAEAPTSFVGSYACAKCHGDYYASFQKSAKKAQSYAAVEKMKKKLSPKELAGCYACHTTGYGKPGGFQSLEETPDLANAGCEVCHGAGSRHVKSTDKADIQRLPDLATCETCHLASRIKAFNYRPVLRAGAH